MRNLSNKQFHKRGGYLAQLEHARKKRIGRPDLLQQQICKVHGTEALASKGYPLKVGNVPALRFSESTQVLNLPSAVGAHLLSEDFDCTYSFRTGVNVTTSRRLWQALREGSQSRIGLYVVDGKLVLIRSLLAGSGAYNTVDLRSVEVDTDYTVRVLRIDNTATVYCNGMLLGQWTAEKVDVSANPAAQIGRTGISYEGTAYSFSVKGIVDLSMSDNPPSDTSGNGNHGSWPDPADPTTGPSLVYVDGSDLEHSGLTHGCTTVLIDNDENNDNYIDWDVTADNTTVLEVTADPLESDTSANGALIGTYNTPDNTRAYMGYRGNNDNNFIFYANGGYIYAGERTGPRTSRMDLSTGDCYVDGELVGNVDTTGFVGGSTIRTGWVLGLARPWKTAYQSVRIWKGGKLVRDAVPCDGGMLDLESGRVFNVSGTGTTTFAEYPALLEGQPTSAVLTLDGVGDWLYKEGAVSLNGSYRKYLKFTTGALDTGTHEQLIGRAYSGYAPSCGVTLRSGHIFIRHVDNTGTYRDNSFTGVAVAPYTDYELTVVYDADAGRVYVKLNDVNANAENLIVPNTSNRWTIGAGERNNQTARTAFFRGQMHKAKVWYDQTTDVGDPDIDVDFTKALGKSTQVIDGFTISTTSSLDSVWRKRVADPKGVPVDASTYMPLTRLGGRLHNGCSATFTATDPALLGKGKNFWTDATGTAFEPRSYAEILAHKNGQYGQWARFFIADSRTGFPYLEELAKYFPDYDIGQDVKQHNDRWAGQIIPTYEG